MGRFSLNDRKAPLKGRVVTSRKHAGNNLDCSKVQQFLEGAQRKKLPHFFFAILEENVPLHFGHWMICDVTRIS
jgi:hypothetical protein